MSDEPLCKHCGRPRQAHQDFKDFCQAFVPTTLDIAALVAELRVDCTKIQELYEEAYSEGVPKWRYLGREVVGRLLGYVSLLCQAWEEATARLTRQKELWGGVAWHRDGFGPDVPVLQPRYDALQSRLAAAEKRVAELEAAFDNAMLDLKHQQEYKHDAEQKLRKDK